jgi:hemolysin activation/secretion protein
VLEVDNLEVFQDNIPTHDDRLRSIEVGATTTQRNTAALTQLNFGVERSLGGLGSEMGSFSGFTIAQLHYLAMTQLGEAWTVRWDSYGQYTAQVLPSIKQFKVGGNRIGRGFEAAAVSGDRGLGSKIELRRRMSDVSGPLGSSAVYGYYDLGAAWKNDTGGRESAASAGVGFAIRGERLSSYLEVAMPLTHVDADGSKNAGLFAELSFQF